MTREANIPLFLWIATAVVAHGLWGGGADHAAKLAGETMEIRDFAASVRRVAQGRAKPLEVSLIEDPDAPEEEDEPDPDAEVEEREEKEPEVTDATEEDDPSAKPSPPDPNAPEEKAKT